MKRCLTAPVCLYRGFEQRMRQGVTNGCELIQTFARNYVLNFRSGSRASDTIRQFYYLNMNVIVEVSLGLIASRTYDAIEKIDSEVGLNFGLSTWVTIQFLITAYFEYYYFIQTIKTTNHLMDALSPLGLGAIQGIAIYCLRRNGSVANLWWLWEFLYVSFGIFAFVHSWLHISVSDMDDCGKTIISETIILSVVKCLQMWVVIGVGGVAAHFGAHWLANLMLVMMSLIAATLTLKSWRYLNTWEKSSLRSEPAN
jgi:hypothetical protein